MIIEEYRAAQAVVANAVIKEIDDILYDGDAQIDRWDSKGRPSGSTDVEQLMVLKHWIYDKYIYHD